MTDLFLINFFATNNVIKSHEHVHGRTVNIRCNFLDNKIENPVLQQNDAGNVLFFQKDVYVRAFKNALAKVCSRIYRRNITARNYVWYIMFNGVYAHLPCIFSGNFLSGLIVLKA